MQEGGSEVPRRGGLGGREGAVCWRGGVWPPRCGEEAGVQEGSCLGRSGAPSGEGERNSWALVSVAEPPGSGTRAHRSQTPAASPGSGFWDREAPGEPN